LAQALHFLRFDKGQSNVPLPLAIALCRSLICSSLKDVPMIACPEADASFIILCFVHFAATQIQFSLKLYY